MSERTAVVFGGAGFIGTHLLESLASSGNYSDLVSADIREPARAVSGVHYKFCDVRQDIPDDLAGAGRAAGGAVDEIYNLAAVHKTPGHPEHAYYETNVLGAVNVTDFARRKHTPVMVFTSSIVVYGPTETPKDEDSPLQPTIAYGWSKRIAETIHRTWQKSGTDRRLTIVRPAVIYGPGERGNFTRLARAMKQGIFAFPGHSETIKACGYVGELVRSMAFVTALQRPLAIYNFCYPTRYTTRAICDAFKEEGRLKAPLGTLPSWLMRLAALAFEGLNAVGVKNSINRARVAKLLDSTNVLPKFLVENGYRFETDLSRSLSLWYLAEPIGQFV